MEQLSIEAERILIGSGAHCEIRLPVDQARVEHVLVELGAAGVFARALSFEPPPTINNVPFTQAPVPPGSILGVGGCQIYVEIAEGQAVTPDKVKKSESSPITLLAATLIIGVGGYMLFTDDPNDVTAKPPPKQTPELWDAPVSACPYGDRAQASAFARERMQIADAKRERRPFHVQDGVQAVPLYESAAACFRAGGDPGSGGLADESAKFLRRDIMDDFRTRRVRLEHALTIEDYVSAQKEVRVLLQFTEGKSGDYVTWLSNLDRKLRLKADAKKS
ncbi:hypothetical protein AKJ09_01129 [Labilithrix luteola]|uniref:Uncharacterized protein n=1 Tax=Labilithrix luteola TaxID=1391654 RepID=A0A0K1PLR3_9BACT|nr:hypothetical protein AKJ09_01129 [Labilithrix luteola]